MKDKKEKQVKNETSNENVKEEVKEEKKVEKKDPNLEKIEKLEKELASWKDKAYRTVADCDNLRKSYEKDHQSMVKYRGQPFVEKMLPTLDSFYMVLKVTPEDPVLKNYLIGFQMIYNGLVQALTDEGVEQFIPTVGKEFDHNTMQAVDVQEGLEDDKIVSVSKPGYMLRDRLVRPAMVVVSKKKVNKNESEEKASEEKGE